MNSFDYYVAIMNWDERRCKEHRFPILATLNYLFWLAIIVWIFYGVYTIGYCNGHREAAVEAIQKGK